MPYTEKELVIGKQVYAITADRDYGAHLGARFEPNTIALLEAMSDKDAHVLDIGANIGITGLALSQLCPAGQIAAVEPVLATFDLLTKNIRDAGVANVRTCNIALGNATGEIVMQGNPNNLSGSFVADMHAIEDAGHFSAVVPLHRLDDVFPTLGLDRLDLMKIDVEGYELDVLDGAAKVLAGYKPAVVMEMNHIALNLWRGISLPEFRRRLLEIFPVVFAEQDGTYLDLRDSAASHTILYQHMQDMSFMNIIAGFDEPALRARLDRLPGIAARNEAFEAGRTELAQAHLKILDLQAQLAGVAEARDRAAAQLQVAKASLHAIESSRSWRLTAPLRGFRRTLGV